MPTEIAAMPAMEPVMGELTTEHLNFRSGCSAYDGNPLIGALGKIRDRDESVANLSSRGKYSAAQQALPDQVRVHCVRTLNDLFVPSYASMCVDQEIGLLLRQGYAARNPLSAEYRQQVRDDRPFLKRKEMPPARYVHQALLGAVCSGPPGTGKTVTTRRVAATFAAVIPHSYIVGDGVRLSFTQVPVLMLEVMPDSTVKELARIFFKKLGERVARDLMTEWSIEASSESSIQSYIYAACREYHVGLLIIDEIQNLSGKGHKKGYVIEYIVRLMNTIGLPILVIGSAATGSLMESWLAIGRRFTSTIPMFKRFQEGPDWDLFLSCVLSYKYTRGKDPCPAELSKKFLDLTAGVPDLVIKLYALTQTRMFGRPVEDITAADLDETAAELFYLVSGQITSLKGYPTSGADTAAVRAEVEEHRQRVANDVAERAGKPLPFPSKRADQLTSSPKPRIGVASAEKGEVADGQPAAPERVSSPPPTVEKKEDDFLARLEREGLLERA